MTTECCGTEIERRRVLFGKVGAIEIETCECEALRIFRRYENSRLPDETVRDMRGGAEPAEPAGT